MTAFARFFEGGLRALRRRAKVHVGSVPMDALGWEYHGAADPTVRSAAESLRISAAWRAVNIISGSIGTLPWIVTETRGSESKRAVSHPLVEFLNDAPNPYMTGPVLMQTLVADVLLSGNCYAEIVRGQDGRAIGMWPLRPNRVEPEYDDQGYVIYRVSAESGDQVFLASEDMFTVPGLAHDGLRGYSILSVARRNLTTAVKLDHYTGDYFNSAFMPSGVVTLPSGVRVTSETVENIRERFRRRAGPDGVHAPFIAGDGMDYKPLSHTASEAQMVDARQFSVRELARWFGVPPYLLYAEGDAPRANVETQSREFRRFSLDPLITKFEREVNRKLVLAPRLYRATIDTREFTLGDTATQVQYWKELRHMGAATVNDVLRGLGMDTIGPAGDHRVMQKQWAPIDPETGAPIEPVSAQPEEADDDDSGEDESEAGDARDSAKGVGQPE